VHRIQRWNFAMFPSWIAASASTIVTELVIRANVLKVASGTPIIERGGTAMCALPLRRMM
jgi:hypothetical protein